MTSNERSTMPDAAERFVRRIRSGADGSLDCRAVFFAGSRIETPERNDLADTLAALANASGDVLVLDVSCRSVRGGGQRGCASWPTAGPSGRRRATVEEEKRGE